MENTLNMELAPTKVHAWHPQQACGKCHFCIRDWARRSVYVNLSMNVDAAPASARVTNVQRVAICALFSNRLIPLWTFIPLVQTCYTSLGFFFFLSLNVEHILSRWKHIIILSSLHQIRGSQRVLSIIWQITSCNLPVFTNCLTYTGD